MLKRRCLLIAPLTFYSFHSSLAAALEQRGYAVELLNEEFPANTLGKILGKLALPILRVLTLAGIKKRLEVCEPYDLVLVIKGRGLGPAALTYLRTRARRIVGYNFDSFEYNPSARDWQPLTDRYATFDIVDAEQINLPLVHLFSAAQTPDLAAQRPYYLSIVQRVHSDRLAYAAKMLDALPKGAQSFVFLYQSSKLLFLFGILRHPLLYRRMWAHISFTPLSYARAMQVLAASRVTFDYAHPRQSGITVRCFEAQNFGTAILTSNRHAVESGLFQPGSIAYLAPDATPEEIQRSLDALAAQVPTPKSRTLDDFLDDLLGEATSS
jgi:hypothetical protein